MYIPHHAGMRPDVRRILLAMAAIAVIVTAAFVSSSADSSEATDTDCKTYYYSQISEYGKAIYDAVPSATFGDDGAGNIIATATIDLSAYAGRTATDVVEGFSDGLDEALACFAMEKVGCYWVGSQWKLNTSYSHDADGKLTKGTVTIRIYGVVTAYGTTDEQVSATMTSVQTALNSVTVDDTSRFTKVSSIHEQVCRILDYDDAKPAGTYCRNIATGLLSDTHAVVCEGYAKLFKALCDLHDVPCLIVTGEAGTGTKEGHMWDYVQMDDGKWYLVDCTWDDQDYDGTNPSNLYTTYLLAGSETTGFNSTKVCDSHLPTTKPLDDSSVEFTLETLNTIRYSSEKFEVQFLNIDGTSCASAEYYPGDVIDMAVADPTYADDKIGTYSFTGWNTSADGMGTAYTKGVTTVSGPMTFHAIYSIDYKDYVYTFDCDNGTSPSVQHLHYGDAVSVPANVTKDASGCFSYVFKAWTLGGAIVTPDATALSTPVTYEASYTATYTVSSSSEEYEVTSSTLTDVKAGADVFVITLENSDHKKAAVITFDKTALNSLAADTLSVKKIPFSSISQKAQDSLGDAIVYRIDFGSNNSVFSSGKATVSLAFSKSSSDDNPQLYYVNGDEVEKVSSTYSSGRIVFETNHFSDYAVKVTGSDDDALDLSWFYPIIAIVIVAFIAMIAVYKHS